MKTTRNFLVHVFVLVVCLCMAAPAGAELIQHLDASVPESIVMLGDQVQQWKDLSGNNNHAIAYIGTVTYPSAPFPGGPVGLNFGLEKNTLELFSVDAQYQWLDQIAGTSGFTVALVTFTTANSGTWNDILASRSTVSNAYGIRYGSDGDAQVYMYGGLDEDGNIQPGETMVWTHTYDATTGVSETWNNQGDGAPRFTDKAPGDFSHDDLPVTLSGSNSGSRFLIGFIGEVRIYDAPLSQAEQDLLRADLISISGSHRWKRK